MVNSKSRCARFISILLFLLCLPNICPAAQSEEESEDFSDMLAGDMFGIRSALSAKGLELEAVYTGEINSNLSGGIEQKTALLGNFDLVLYADGSKGFGWNGFGAKLYVLGNHGDDPTENTGDALAASNIEAPVDFFKIYEAWVSQSLFEQKFQILLGMHDLNSEFYATESSGLFFNSAFGIGSELAQTGENGPSIFPQTSPALFAKFALPLATDIKVAAYNARSGNPENQNQSYGRMVLV